jgi:hypothetical protein
MQNPTRLDIISLINNSPISILSKDYQTKLLTKIEESFTDNQQQLFVASFYCYLNHDLKKDFVISLDNVWKWCGFARIDPAKRVLEKNFTIDVDYKIEKAAPPTCGTGTDETILHQPVENKKNIETRGRKELKILMTVNAFKKFCLKAGTKKADEIHDYYIKLEELLQETMNEESRELRLQLEVKEKLIEQLENKPETEGFFPKPGYVYLIKDNNSSGSYKIGLGENPQTRLITLNTSSSQKTLEIFSVFKTSNMKSTEKIVHVLLEPFRIKKRNEWFYFINDLELIYAINTIKDVIVYVDKYNFKNYDEFKMYAGEFPNNLQEIKNEYIEMKPKNITNRKFKSNDKVSDYLGVSWTPNDKWICRLTKDYETIFLGYYDTEIEAAITYNDFATYINNECNLNYTLNDIDNYVPNPRNIPEENVMKKLENKSSNFSGVYFIKSKQIFEASIQYKKKTYKLYKNVDDLECAKIFNEQALYFNNHLGTKYKLNEILNFITIEKNHILEIDMKKLKKYSRFIGVSVRNDSNKFRAYIKYNGKRIDCGTFKHEIDAAKAYNEKAIELNKLETTKHKYSLNEIEV